MPELSAPKYIEKCDNYKTLGCLNHVLKSHMGCCKIYFVILKGLCHDHAILLLWGNFSLKPLLMNKLFLINCEANT